MYLCLCVSIARLCLYSGSVTSHYTCLLLHFVYSVKSQQHFLAIFYFLTFSHFGLLDVYYTSFTLVSRKFVGVKAAEKVVIFAVALYIMRITITELIAQHDKSLDINSLKLDTIALCNEFGKSELESIHYPDLNNSSAQSVLCLFACSHSESFIDIDFWDKSSVELLYKTTTICYL